MTATEDQARSIFFAALDRAPDGWPAFLDEACGADAQLRARVGQLLHAHRAIGSIHGAGADAPTATAAATAADSPGTPIGPYKLVEVIGEGGMGTVYLAQQQAPVKRLVALKVIKAGMDSRSVLARFEAERQALALMDHPNIAKVHDAGATPDGRPFFVMELVKGTPITRYCDEHRLTPRDRLDLFVPVCQAVQHAHQKGVIHRDLKPSNVLVAPYDGRPVVKVIDFGVAKAFGQPLTEKTLVTGFGAIVGTLEYMSTEQAEINQLDVDTRSDIYSLGVLLYELLTGTTPLERERVNQSGILEALRVIREEEVPTLSNRLGTTAELPSIAANRSLDPARLTRLVKGELDWMVMKCLEKDRTRRYETAAGLAADIGRYLADEPVLACPPSAWYRFSKFARRNKRVAVLTGSVAAMLVVALAVLGFSYAQVQEALRDKTQALEREQQSLYFQRIATAAHARAIRRNGRAEELLELCRPRFRGWEWHYLKRLPFADFPTLSHEKRKTVIRVAYSPDGRLMASGDLEGVVKTWNAQTGEWTHFASAPDQKKRRLVHGLVFTPDSQFLAEGGEGDRLNLWNAWTGELVGEFLTGKRVLVALAISPDGQQLAAAFKDGNVRLWDVPTGLVNWSIEDANWSIQDDPLVFDGLAFSSGGNRLLCVSVKGVVTARDRASGQVVSRPDTGFRPLVCAAFSRDSRLVALGSELGTVKVVQAETCEVLWTLEGHISKVLGLAFAAGDDRLATSAHDLTVKIWDLKTGQEALNLDTSNEGRVYCLAFSPDGYRLAAGNAENAVKVLDGTPLAGSGQRRETVTLEGHADSVVRMVFSPNGERVASASWDKTARVWDARTGRELLTLRGHENALTAVAFSRDGRRIATASLDETVRVWDADTGAEVCCLRGEGGAVYDVAFNHDGRALASAHDDGKVRVWDPATGQHRDINAHSYPVMAVAFSPNGRLLASGGGQEHTVKVWEEGSTGKFALKHILDGPDASTWSTAFSSKGRFVVSISRTPGEVWLWDLMTSDNKSRVKSRKIPTGGRIFRAVVSPDDRRLAVVHADRVQIWDMTTEQELYKLEGHTGDLWSANFSPDGRRLATGAGYKGKGEVRIWDLADWEKRAALGRRQPPD